MALVGLPELTNAVRERSCESELRLCFESNELDSTFDEGVQSWHSLCDTYVTFSPTTKALSSVTQSIDGDFCNFDVHSACKSAQLLLSSCTHSSIITDELRFSSCLCAPQLLSLDYTCEVFGNSSCFYTDATLSSLILYSCSNFQDVIGTGLVRLIPIYFLPCLSRPASPRSLRPRAFANDFK